DDPIAAAEALTVTQSKDATAQYSTNVDTAKTALGLNDSVLGQVTNVLQSIRVLAVNGGNAGLNNNDRASLATDVAGQLEQLIGLANTRDGNGNYLFSGYQIDTQPFVTTSSANVSYNGDQGQRLLQVSAARSLAINENGSAVFEQIKNGNGTFTAGAAWANTGTGVIDGGRGTKASALTGN